MHIKPVTTIIFEIRSHNVSDVRASAVVVSAKTNDSISIQIRVTDMHHVMCLTGIPCTMPDVRPIIIALRAIDQSVTPMARPTTM